MGEKGRSSTRVCRRLSGSRDGGGLQADLRDDRRTALGGNEDAARPGTEAVRELRLKRERPIYEMIADPHGEGAWGNGRSTCDALRRGMKEGAPERPLRRATSYPSRSFSGTGRPAEAQCTQPVTCYREGRRARRTPTLFQKIPLGRPPESEARSVTVHPGSGKGPPGF